MDEVLKFDRALGYIPGIGQVEYKELRHIGHNKYRVIVELAPDYELPNWHTVQIPVFEPELIPDTGEEE